MRRKTWLLLAMVLLLAIGMGCGGGGGSSGGGGGSSNNLFPKPGYWSGPGISFTVSSDSSKVSGNIASNSIGNASFSGSVIAGAGFIAYVNGDTNSVYIVQGQFDNSTCCGPWTKCYGSSTFTDSMWTATWSHS
ncbi:MAG: hypothetical protein ABSE95_05875 [Thermodesulfobacteriota bacterium]|jgi:hypothetical protein